MTKYIAKQEKTTGKWAIFARTGNKMSGYIDTFVQEVPHGMHIACRIAENMNRGAA